MWLLIFFLTTCNICIRKKIVPYLYMPKRKCHGCKLLLKKIYALVLSFVPHIPLTKKPRLQTLNHYIIGGNPNKDLVQPSCILINLQQQHLTCDLQHSHCFGLAHAISHEQIIKIDTITY